MRINSVDINKIFNKIPKNTLGTASGKRISTPNLIFGTGIAAMSGMYLTNKSKEENSNTKTYDDKNIKIKTKTGEKRVTFIQWFVNTKTRQRVKKRF